MELKSQVISLELAKRLKALGVKQEGEYEWEWSKTPLQRAVLKTSGVRGCGRCGAIINGIPRPTQFAERAIAFTVAELGGMLPFIFKQKGKDMGWESYKAGDSGGWESWFIGENAIMIGSKFMGQTEAEVRGLLLEYLITNKLISI